MQFTDVIIVIPMLCYTVAIALLSVWNALNLTDTAADCMGTKAGLEVRSKLQ